MSENDELQSTVAVESGVAPSVEATVAEPLHSESEIPAEPEPAAVGDGTITEPVHSESAEPPVEPEPVAVDTSAEPTHEPTCGELAAMEPTASDDVEEIPANSAWMPLSEIVKSEFFHKLSRDGKELLLHFWRTGSRRIAVEEVWGLPRETESNRLASYTFSRGELARAVDAMMGKSEREILLDAITRATLSRKTSRAQLEALRLQAEILGLLPKDSETASGDF